MRKKEKKATPDLIEACQRLAEAAETFVNRAPRQKRLEHERSALFDALSHAQLVLSVTRIPQRRDHASPKPVARQQEAQQLAEDVHQLKTELTKSQQAREKLDRLIQPLTTTLDEIKDKAETVLQAAAQSPGRLLLLKKSR